MKIKRNVNGQEMEFELTHGELYKAFYEQERECHKEDIQLVAVIYIRNGLRLFPGVLC